MPAVVKPFSPVIPALPKKFAPLEIKSAIPSLVSYPKLSINELAIPYDSCNPAPPNPAAISFIPLCAMFNAGVNAFDAAAFIPADPKLLAATASPDIDLRSSNSLLNRSIIFLILSCNASALPETVALRLTRSEFAALNTSSLSNQPACGILAFLGSNPAVANC